MIFIALAILALAWASYFSTKSKEKYHVRPRVMWAQVVVMGRTEDSETVQLTASLFEDESTAAWTSKTNWLYEEREKRLKFQNDRILALHAEQEQRKKNAEAALKDAGIKLVPPAKV